MKETFEQFASPISIKTWQAALTRKYPHYYDIKDYTGLNAVDEHGYTLLMHAVKQKEHNVTEALLKEGANPNLQRIYYSGPLNDPSIRYAGDSALILAAKNDDVRAAQILCDYNANINIFVLYTVSGLGSFTVTPWDDAGPNVTAFFQFKGFTPKEGEWKKSLKEGRFRVINTPWKKTPDSPRLIKN